MEQNQVYITSKEGLKAALTDILSELNLIQIPEPEPKAPATRQEASNFLSISLPTLDKLISSNQLPCFYIGRQVRIRRSDMENYVNQKTDSN